MQIERHVYLRTVVSVRDQPFNLQGGYGFFFRTTQELEYLFVLVRKARKFFPEFNIRLYDKISESDYFFSSTKIRIFFQQHWESEYFFRKKTIASPPLEVKWSIPKPNEKGLTMVYKLHRKQRLSNTNPTKNW